MNFANFLYLAQEGGQQPGGLMSMLPLIVGLFLIMYFVMIRPQMKEQKKRRAMLAALKKHDNVLTSGGVYGTVVSLTETDAVLKVDENCRIKFARSAVSAILNREGEEETPPAK
jgi:preprotein translocase subunit YajC